MNCLKRSRWDWFGGSLMILLGGMLVSASFAQKRSVGKSDSVLQRRYDAAQSFQAAHELDKAAQQYRIFISDALGELAIGWAHAGEYDKAADYFDESLRLVPDFPAMQIAYARAALDSGNLEHAQLLATGVLRSDPSNAKVDAEAHVLLGRVLLKQGKDTEAKQQIQAAVALDPTFENGYELAVADLDLGDGNGAKKIFAEMLASFGDTAAIHMYFGQAYGSSDFQADAVEEFKKAVAKDDRLPEVHYSLAAAYLSTSGDAKLPEAEAELRKEIAISPKDAAAYAALGHLLAKQHRDAAEDAEAESDLKRATELDPKSPDGFLYLGQMDADMKKPTEAESALRRSIALTTDVSRNGFQVQKAHYLLGRLLMQTGDTAAGNKEMATSQALMQQNLAQGKNQLSDYLQEKSAQTTPGMGPAMPMAVEEKPVDERAAEQMGALEKQLGPAIADSYNNLGAIAGGESDFVSALRDFESAAEWNPALPGLDYNWGRAAYAARAFQTAVGPLSRYLQAHPESDDVRAELGLSQMNVKEFAEARKTLQPLDEKTGESPQLQYAYAESLIETGDTNGGVQRLVALEKANPEVGEVHRALGEAYAAEKDPNAAMEFETAIRKNPADAEAHVELARLKLAQGDAKGAVMHLETAAKLEPGNAAVQKELAEANSRVMRK